MQFLLSAILLLAPQGGLDSYHLTIDPDLLDSLYSNPHADYQFPALIETESGACSCMAGFRGGTSLWLPKLSWKIVLSDTSLADGSHILLDAQYRDLSMMRNALGLWLTRRLGRPGPRTEHVEYYVNGQYYGVYLQVERIDEFFFDRIGQDQGHLFKAVGSEARFAWQPADTSLITGFEPKLGSSDEIYLIRRMIDRVNLDLPLNISIEDIIAYAAVTLAIEDTDAMVKNYYAHVTPDGEWRFYPWDRDASFGNAWDGTYSEDWTGSTSTYGLSITPILTRLLRDDENRDLLADYVEELSDIFTDELPGIIDSIQIAIRPSLEADTLKQGTIEDFDEAAAVLREAVIERGTFLPSIASGHQPAEVISMELSDWELTPGIQDTVTVSIEFAQPASGIALTWWMDDGEVVYTWMNPETPDETRWSREIIIPPDAGHIQFAVRAAGGSSGEYNSTYFQPMYGHPPAVFQRVAAPTARRSAYPFEPHLLEVLSPVRYTSFLWVIPLVNASSTPQDLSFCGFQAGDPAARTYGDSGLVLQPGDTLLLTNDMELLMQIDPERSIIGDLVLDTPANSILTILDPSWGIALEVPLDDEVQYGQAAGRIVLSEICHSGGNSPGDWVELHNTGEAPFDLTGCILMDDQAHMTELSGISVEPGGFLVLCEEEDSFLEFYGSDTGPTAGMSFGLDADGDGLSLFRGNDLLFDVEYEAGPWPVYDDSILYLLSPELPEEDPASWGSTVMPGSPGALNPGWFDTMAGPVLGSPTPNPVTSSFTLDYTVSFLPAEVSIYDISGRLVLEPEPITVSSGALVLEPSGLAPGVYFAVVRSCGRSASVKFLLLR